ncbi:hypothetical protein K469DRAFT_684277 [Zopfia rhizophila CBS 207.26]|uniref:SRR1-like domain-containing protein n=1 Tax=Zopfia rhizophila CBS 207.26 TaxID=1314779 RepID=A0A6A6EEM1_9PEZI|nr:hypothetical protein K469DRAFT_684277 [Zopfia rhizophila CBS 207.26]
MSGSAFSHNLAYVQHRAISIIARALETMYAEDTDPAKHELPPIKIIAQDPSYTHNDTKIMYLLGITPISDPHGFLSVEKHTLVFSPNCMAPAFEIITKLLPSGPTGIFGNNMWFAKSREKTLFNACDDSSPRVQNMMHGYSTYNFDYFLTSKEPQYIDASGKFSLRGIWACILNRNENLVERRVRP